MIPLRASHTVRRIHPLIYVLLAIWALTKIWISFAGAGSLESVALVPAHFSPLRALGAAAFHESIFATITALLYFWVFAPAIFELFKPWRLLGAALAGTVLAMWLFAKIHSEATAPVLSSEAFLGFYLGAFMRKDIWGTVDTLVIGPGWLRIFSVPSYVLLFFWFFYLLIGNLALDPPFSDAPMLYLVPLLGFLTGFAYASLPTTWILNAVQRSDNP